MHARPGCRWKPCLVTPPTPLHPIISTTPARALFPAVESVSLISAMFVLFCGALLDDEKYASSSLLTALILIAIIGTLLAIAVAIAFDLARLSEEEGAEVRGQKGRGEMFCVLCFVFCGRAWQKEAEKGGGGLSHDHG